MALTDAPYPNQSPAGVLIDRRPRDAILQRGKLVFGQFYIMLWNGKEGFERVYSFIVGTVNVRLFELSTATLKKFGSPYCTRKKKQQTNRTTLKLWHLIVLSKVNFLFKQLKVGHPGSEFFSEYLMLFCFVHMVAITIINYQKWLTLICNKAWSSLAQHFWENVYPSWFYANF